MKRLLRWFFIRDFLNVFFLIFISNFDQCSVNFSESVFDPKIRKDVQFFNKFTFLNYVLQLNAGKVVFNSQYLSKNCIQIYFYVNGVNELDFSIWEWRMGCVTFCGCSYHDHENSSYHIFGCDFERNWFFLYW